METIQYSTQMRAKIIESALDLAFRPWKKVGNSIRESISDLWNELDSAMWRKRRRKGKDDEPTEKK